MNKPLELFDVVKEELDEKRFYLWLYFVYGMVQKKFTDEDIESLEHHFKILKEDQKKEK